MSYTSTLVLLLHLIYLSYLSNVYRACSFFTNSELFCIDYARYLSKNTVIVFRNQCQELVLILYIFLKLCVQDVIISCMWKGTNCIV
jgi:hypothetical protein